MNNEDFSCVDQFVFLDVGKGLYLFPVFFPILLDLVNHRLKY